MNKKEKLTEATMLALQGKLNEVYVKEYIGTFDDLYQSSWGPAKEILQHISDLGLEQECMDWLEDFGTEDAPIDRTELNDYIWNNSEDLYDALGLDENGDPINDDEDDLDESKKVEKNLVEDEHTNKITDDDLPKDNWTFQQKDLESRLDSLINFACDWCGGVFKANYPTIRKGNTMPTCPYCGKDKDVHKLDDDLNTIYENKKVEKKLTEDEYTENLKAAIRDNDTLTFTKNWLDTIDTMVNDLTNEYNDMYQDVRDAIDNLFSGSTPTSCLVGLSNAIRDVKEELENIKF